MCTMLACRSWPSRFNWPFKARLSKSLPMLPVSDPMPALACSDSACACCAGYVLFAFSVGLTLLQLWLGYTVLAWLFAQLQKLLPH